uniref:GAGA-binding transcriptional activator n=1 Tax=Kalanchoe fedtschenkoi TaxID=63787 RepID=A0A7N0UID4_KALFE
MDPFFAILSERNEAMRERNMAIAEIKQAIAQRDMAILERDAAVTDRDHARMQRDDAIAQLQLKTDSMNTSIVIHNPSESAMSVSLGAKQMQMQQQQQQQQRRQHLPNYSEVAFNPREVPFSDVFPQSTAGSKATRAKRGKHAKEKKTVSPNKALKPARKIAKKRTRVSNKQLTATSHHSSDSGRSGNLEKQIVLKGGLSLNELGLDDVNLPVPFCSCTGKPQSCYKWGKGGWQSACCTTALSMYPLPQMPNKRHSRMGGRKMSGGAFTKLITRLASEGYDITVPIDLKTYWAKHGTNRYITIR